MLVPPDSTIRVAASEATTLQLETDLTISKAALHPLIGGEQGLPVEGNAATLPAVKAPDLITVDWFVGDQVMFTTRVEVVTRHYFNLDALRAYGDGQDDFDSLPEAELYEVRQAATEVFERNAHRSFVRRVGKTVDYKGSGTSYIQLDHYDVDEMLTPGYTLVSDCQAVRYKDSPHPTEVSYIYGLGDIPAQVSRAVLELAAYMLRPSNRPIGATGESTDAGFIRFTTAGQDGFTDIPEVNAAIDQFGRGVNVLW